jgi:AAA15 family ATPase/GTPase
MITRIFINGFKSFQNYEMTFTPLTIVTGANASGKSNLFDALQLLSRLAEADLKTAFSEQRGNPGGLFTQYDENWYASEMDFTVEMLVNRKVRDNWGGEAELVCPCPRLQ